LCGTNNSCGFNLLIQVSSTANYLPKSLRRRDFIKTTFLSFGEVRRGLKFVVYAAQKNRVWFKPHPVYIEMLHYQINLLGLFY
jgi:hypothetical protein